MRTYLAIILLALSGCTPGKSGKVRQLPDPATVPPSDDAAVPPDTGCGSLNDLQHCGGCANDCSKMPFVAVAGCVNRTCVALLCKPLRGHCSANPLDGCEVDLASADHCGSCELSCTKAHGICDLSSGMPACSCMGSQHLCGGSCVENDNMACGSSCQLCVTPEHGTIHCSGETCQATCEHGYHAVGDKCVVGNFPTPLATWSGVNWYKIMVTGTMSDTNLLAACQASGLTVPCQAMGTCMYNNDLCKNQTPENSCGDPMKGLAVSLGCSSPSSCTELNGVFQYMGGKWQSGSSCGAYNGSWCAVGSMVQNQFALCVEP